jgi:zinc finger SWIM domain-containing protein 3
MQNALKHLSVKGQEQDDEEEVEKEEGEGEGDQEDKEPNVFSDFGACMYGYEDKESFEEAFDIMRTKVHKQTWLDSIYKVKEK